MNEDTQEQDSAPGSGAGDPAQTQQIPHIAKPLKQAVAARPPVRKSAATAALTSKPVTDKGRIRDTTTASDDAEKSAPETHDESTPTASTTDADATAAAEAGAPLTAADYAHTTRPSTSTTSVIPAVKGAPVDRSAPAATDSSGRQARLRLNHIEPWSVTRIAFAISVAMMIVGVVAVTIFWVVLSITGVWDQINGSITAVLSDNSSTFDITDYLGFGRLVGLTLVLSAINVILMTALATIGAHLYNVAAQLLGGIEVTFGEDG